MNNYETALLAISMRMAMRQCPICGAFIEEGFEHNQECKLYLVEKAAQSAWPSPATQNEKPNC